MREYKFWFFLNAIVFGIIAGFLIDLVEPAITPVGGGIVAILYLFVSRFAHDYLIFFPRVATVCSIVLGFCTWPIFGYVPALWVAIGANFVGGILWFVAICMFFPRIPEGDREFRE